MADPQDPFALNIRGVTDLVESDTNKVKDDGSGDPEGASGERFGVLTLKMSDEELLKLRNDWEKRYAPYEAKMKPIFERNLESYLGKKKDGQWLSEEAPIAANLQFEAEETFLSAALAKNPEPVVYSDNTPEGEAIAKAVRTMLQFHADQLVIRRKLSLMVRQWSIYQLGVLKHGWNASVNDVMVENRKIQDFIFDPNGYVDAYGDFVGYLGERITLTAEKLVELYPEHKQYITDKVDGLMGTNVTYTEWWSADDTFTFVTFKEKVLSKNKNPYYKYPEPALDSITGQQQLNGMNEPVMNAPRNHFASPKKPYTFLSVFSLQEQPHDITSLIEQNIPNQNRITRRTEQIDYNASAANNAYAFSEDNFNQETAKQAANARKKGNPILIPSGGPIEKSILPLAGQEIPTSIFNELEISKNDLRQSWGINGITSQPQEEDQTARGMILNQQNDTSRIGGGIGDAIEQVADNVFNWITQLYYVFYDEEHFAAIVGNAKAVEYVTLSNRDLSRQLIVSVSPDSMRPRDEITEINLAQALFDKGAIGPKTLLKMLSFPNPDEAAADGLLYKMDPMTYMQLNFPDFAQKLMASQQQQAMLQMQNQAQGTMLNAQAQAAGTPPEATTEPKQSISKNPADAGLEQVDLPPL